MLKNLGFFRLQSPITSGPTHGPFFDLACSSDCTCKPGGIDDCPLGSDDHRSPLGEWLDGVWIAICDVATPMVLRTCGLMDLWTYGPMDRTLPLRTADLAWVPWAHGRHGSDGPHGLVRGGTAFFSAADRMAGR